MLDFLLIYEITIGLFEQSLFWVLMGDFIFLKCVMDRPGRVSIIELDHPLDVSRFSYKYSDSNSLAFYNIRPSSLVLMTLKERGGRKK